MNNSSNINNNSNYNYDNNSVSNASGKYVYNAYRKSTNIEEINEERRLYLLEKEEQIKIRYKRKKLISLVILFVVVSIVGFYLYNKYFRPVKIDERIDRSSIHYATDLYYSDGRYYEEYLDEKEKDLYLDFFNSLKDLKTEVSIDCTKYGYPNKGSCASSIVKLIDIVLLDHPDLFWYRTSSYSYREDSNITVKHHYVSNNKVRLYFVERRLLRKIDELANDFGKLDTDYDKVKAVYDWLGKNKSYSSIMTRKDGTAWSAILDDDTVCAGYAAASQLLFQRLGIESTVVIGYTGEGHAWNFVKLDDGYYWYDATVGGSLGGDSPYFYNGLLFSDTSDYSVTTIDLKKYKFGTKYLDK